MSEQPRENFLNVCRSFDQAMLVTQSDQGQLVARPMMIACLEDNGDLWCATDCESGKVDEVLSHPEVCVTMAGNDRYASISGLGEIVDDRTRVADMWSEVWRVWFPEGPDDPRMVLIRVHAATGEYWSHAGTNRIKYLFEAAKAYTQGKRMQESDSAQHGRVAL